MSARLPIVCAASLLALVPTLAAAQPLTFERRLTVGASPSLDVTSGSGNITVRGGDGTGIVVKGTVTARSGWGAPPNAVELAKRVADAPPIVQNGDAVRVGHIADEATRNAVSIAYEITAPAGTVVAASSGSGSISVTSVGRNVQAKTGSGNIAVASIGGAVTLRTGSGDIVAKEVKQAADLSTGSGDITATLTGKGDVRANSGSGSIQLTGVTGLVTASSASGNVHVNGRPTGDWKLSAASGDVLVQLPSEQGFTLDATTSSGDLDVAGPLSVQGKIEKRRIQGTVRGGGPTLRVSTASGDIAVR